MTVFQNILNLRQGNGNAPHKPILLLAMIDCFERGVYSSQFIDINSEIISSFEGLWNELAASKWTMNFALPFFHLSKEKEEFWRLIPKQGKVIPITKSHSIKSFRALIETVLFAEISYEFLDLLIIPDKRSDLRIHILNKYFDKKELPNYKDPYQKLEQEVLSVHTEEHINSFQEELKTAKDPERKTYTLFVRNSKFSKVIKSVYSNKCAISGIQIASQPEMLDACHIIPFSDSYDNSIYNGIALTPTLHRAFDAGLIAIDDNYEVLVSKNIIEDESSPYYLRQFESKSIINACDQKYLPGLKNLKIHREKFRYLSN